MYRVIFDNGKPSEETFNNEADLKAGLKKFYLENKYGGIVDCFVYFHDGKDEADLTDSQFINEMIEEILEEVNQ